MNHAFSFAAFNALSFQIVLGSPMVLYAKSLDASATVLGIIAGMMPLLVIFQIPAANYVDRIGYKKFVYAGWGIRVAFIFVIALVPITAGFLNATTRLALILLLLFAFNLSRGISSCAWLPWMTTLVPAEVRGKYLAREAGFVNLASFTTVMLAALCLGKQPAASQFAITFVFSALMGAVSLSFLKRIPDAPVQEHISVSKTPVPYREMTRFAPFRKLLWEVAAWAVAYGGMTTFTVAFLKAESAMAEGTILMVSAFAFLGGFGSLWFLGPRIDRLGSKPVLVFSFGAWLVILAGWAAVAGGWLPLRMSLILMLQFCMGLAAALVNMANTRLAMAIIPPMGRNHFFAIYSVVLNVTLGLAPIFWGLLIDAVGAGEWHSGAFRWNRFSIFFAAVWLAFVVSLLLSRRLEEPAAASTEALLKELLIQSPQRVLIKLWPRV
ncbi:MAG: MFS transporter [Verrucomicrobia bacterium]|nr:MFS transporter [Verrucomicrobiota bacterium]